MSDKEKIREDLFGRGRWTFGGDGSHWDGCENVHWDCALVHLTARIAELEGALKNVVANCFQIDNGTIVVDKSTIIHAQEVLK